MKTIEFQGQEFRVHEWAKYITQDVDGWYVWEDTPVFSDNAYYCETPFRRVAVYPVRKDYPAIMEIV